MGGIVSTKKEQEPEPEHEEPEYVKPSIPEKPELAQWAPPAPKNRDYGMRIVTLEDLKRLRAIPLPTAPEVQPLAAMGRRPVFLVYVSHTWLDSEEGLPDDADNTKCKAIIEAMEALKEKHLSEDITMAAWIDYCCMPKGAQQSGVNMADCLPFYMSMSNAVLSIVFGEAESVPSTEIEAGSAAMDEGKTGDAAKDEGDAADAADADSEGETRAEEAHPNAPENDFTSSAWGEHWTWARTRLDATLSANTSLQGQSHELREAPMWTLQEHLPRRFSIICGPRVPMTFMKPLGSYEWAKKYPVLKGEQSAGNDLEHLEQMLQEIFPSLLVGEYNGETDIEGRRDGTGSCTFLAGGSYEGEWLAGKVHGRGRFEFPWGDSYEGASKDGKRHGDGTYTYASGNRYCGHFEQNKRHGLGVYSYMSGAEYDGAFAFDQRHGYGKYTFANGDVFEGDYIRGQMQGDGKLTRADGSVYVGPWKDGKMHGHATFTFSNGGSRYIGEYENGEMHGNGTYTFANGDVFRGQYVNGDMVKGTFLFVNGDRYIGEFRKGKMHGSGRFENADGDKYEGEFVNNLKHGAGIVIRSDGSRFEGTFKQGKKHGPGWYRTTDGTWFEAEWDNGARCRASEMIAHPPYYETQETGLKMQSRPAMAQQLPSVDSTWSADSVDIRIGRPDDTSPREKRRAKPPRPYQQDPLSGSRSYSALPRHSRDGSRPSSAATPSQRRSFQEPAREIQRKARPYRQHHHLSVPSPSELDRYRRTHPSPNRRERPSSATPSPGAWVQYASPGARIASANRYGIPPRLLNLLASEAEGLGANPFTVPAQRIATIKSIASLEPSFKPSKSRPSSAPYSYKGTVTAIQQQQVLEKGRCPRTSLGTRLHTSPARPSVPAEMRRTLATETGKGNPPVADTAWSASAGAYQHHASALSTVPQCSQPSISSSSPSFSWDPVEYGKDVMKWKDAAADSDRWHPGIPMPSYRDEDAEIPQSSIIGSKDRMGVYHRTYHASLTSVAESL